MLSVLHCEQQKFLELKRLESGSGGFKSRFHNTFSRLWFLKKLQSFWLSSLKTLFAFDNWALPTANVRWQSCNEHEFKVSFSHHWSIKRRPHRLLLLLLLRPVLLLRLLLRPVLLLRLLLRPLLCRILPRIAAKVQRHALIARRQHPVVVVGAAHRKVVVLPHRRKVCQTHYS